MSEIKIKYRKKPYKIPTKIKYQIQYINTYNGHHFRRNWKSLKNGNTMKHTLIVELPDIQCLLYIPLYKKEITKKTIYTRHQGYNIYTSDILSSYINCLYTVYFVRIWYWRMNREWLLLEKNTCSGYKCHFKHNHEHTIRWVNILNYFFGSFSLAVSCL